MAQAKVLKALTMAGVAPQGLHGVKPTSMRLVEYENQLGATSRTGSMTPSVPLQLAWFVEYDKVKQAISVPPIRSRKGSSSVVTSNLWVDVVVLSARTGAVIDAFDYSE